MNDNERRARFERQQKERALVKRNNEAYSEHRRTLELLDKAKALAQANKASTPRRGVPMPVAGINGPLRIVSSGAWLDTFAGPYLRKFPTATARGEQGSLSLGRSGPMRWWGEEGAKMADEKFVFGLSGQFQDVWVNVPEIDILEDNPIDLVVRAALGLDPDDVLGSIAFTRDGKTHVRRWHEES